MQKGKGVSRLSAAPISAVSREDQVTLGQQEEDYFGYSSPLAQSMKKQRAEKESSGLTEMLQEAREKADAHQKELDKLKKINPRYGDAPLEAYARISRARTPAQAGSAAGYARRRAMQLRAAQRTDPEHADQIKAAAGQLEKAAARANRKKLELNREQLSRARMKRMVKENRRREAQRIRQELRKSQTMRAIRESGYFKETEIANRQADQLTATKMELKAQAEQLGAVSQGAIDAAIQGYSEGTQLATVDLDAPMQLPQVDVQA